MNIKKIIKKLVKISELEDQEQVVPELLFLIGSLKEKEPSIDICPSCSNLLGEDLLVKMISEEEIDHDVLHALGSTIEKLTQVGSLAKQHPRQAVIITRMDRYLRSIQKTINIINHNDLTKVIKDKLTAIIGEK